MYTIQHQSTNCCDTSNAADDLEPEACLVFPATPVYLTDDRQRQRDDASRTEVMLFMQADSAMTALQIVHNEMPRKMREAIQ